MAKTKKTEKPTGTKESLKMLVSFMKPYKWYFAGALFFNILQVAATLLAPVFIGEAINYMVYQNVNFIGIMESVYKIIGCILSGFTFNWLMQVFINKISFEAVRDIRAAAFKKINSVPLGYIDSHSHGDIMSRITNDTELVMDGLIQGFSTIFSGVITIIGTIAIMFTLNYLISIVIVVITPVSLAVSYFIAKGTHKMFTVQAEQRGEMSGLVTEMIANQKVVKAFNHEKDAEERFDKINAKLQVSGTKAMFYSAISNPTTRLVNNIAYTAVTVLGALMVMNTPLVLNVGILSAFLSYANQYSKPFNDITGVITELQSSFASLRRIKELLDEQNESDDSSLPLLDNFDGTLTAEHVSFGYSKDKPLITDFNLKVKKGERIAIVGPTGCGKTTLINLLMRFYDVDGGKIEVSGKNIKEVTRSSLRAGFGMVLQETWLFNGTIRENIAYGKEDATLDEIMAAADKARIHKFIMRQENGYDTVVKEDGSNISQGQKQLLCIARIMLKNPPMLILDEATSNIDTRTERRIQKAFREMMEGKTSFIIAHRLSTIKDADKILVMNRGDIIESGTHDELLKQEGFYAYLYNSQFQKV